MHARSPRNRSVYSSGSRNYLYVVRQRTGPNVTIARLRHLLARAYVTFARHHRPRLQRIPDIIASMEQYHVAKHYAASSPIMRTWWTQQRAVRLKGDNQAYITRVKTTTGALFFSFSLSLSLL